MLPISSGMIWTIYETKLNYQSPTDSQAVWPIDVSVLLCCHYSNVRKAHDHPQHSSRPSTFCKPYPPPRSLVCHLCYPLGCTYHALMTTDGLWVLIDSTKLAFTVRRNQTVVEDWPLFIIYAPLPRSLSSETFNSWRPDAIGPSVTTHPRCWAHLRVGNRGAGRYFSRCMHLGGNYLANVYFAESLAKEPLLGY